MVGLRDNEGEELLLDVGGGNSCSKVIQSMSNHTRSSFFASERTNVRYSNDVLFILKAVC